MPVSISEYSPYMKRFEQLDLMEWEIYRRLINLRILNPQIDPHGLDTLLDAIGLYYFLNFDPLENSPKQGEEIDKEINEIRKISRKYITDNAHGKVNPISDEHYNKFFNLVRKIAKIRQESGLGWQVRIKKEQAEKLRESLKL